MLGDRRDDCVGHSSFAAGVRGPGSIGRLAPTEGGAVGRSAPSPATAARPPTPRSRRAGGRRAVAVEHEHVGHGALEEGAVVAHDDQRAGPVVEEVLEGAQRVEVEVVGGLVEQQHVRLLRQGQQQLQAAALAAGQERDRRPLGVVVEPERLEQAGVGPVRLPVGPATASRTRSVGSSVAPRWS